MSVEGEERSAVFPDSSHQEAWQSVQTRLHFRPETEREAQIADSVRFLACLAL